MAVDWRAVIEQAPSRWRRMLTPRMPIPLGRRPTRKQTVFLLLDRREVLFGGAAGGGKSEALLMAALMYVDVPHYAAILFRRTYTDLALPGALMSRAHDWLAGRAQWNERKKTWTFPSGATLSFGYLDRSADRLRYQSSEFQFIGFDELTQFREADYTYLFSRLRRTTSAPVPLRMRSASNPGGPGHDWVRRRFLVDGPLAGRIFLPARFVDNPHLDQATYRENLQRLDPVTCAQLLDGDWEIDDSRLIPFESLLACQADTLWPTGRSNDRHGARELYMGVDVGRTQDLTVIWTWERVGDVLWCREMAVLANAPFHEQRDAIIARMARPGTCGLAIDRGGIGYQLAEELV